MALTLTVQTPSGQTAGGPVTSVTWPDPTAPGNFIDVMPSGEIVHRTDPGITPLPVLTVVMDVSPATAGLRQILVPPPPGTLPENLTLTLNPGSPDPSTTLTCLRATVSLAGTNETTSGEETMTVKIKCDQILEGTPG
jgi:hypothetical protein